MKTLSMLCIATLGFSMLAQAQFGQLNQDVLNKVSDAEKKINAQPQTKALKEELSDAAQQKVAELSEQAAVQQALGVVGSKEAAGTDTTLMTKALALLASSPKALADLSQKLNLSDEQKTQMKQLLLSQKNATKQKTATQEADKTAAVAKALSILTDEQKSKLKEMGTTMLTEQISNKLSKRKKK